MVEYVTQSAKNHMGKLVTPFLLLLLTYSLFKVSHGHAFVAINKRKNKCTFFSLTFKI